MFSNKITYIGFLAAVLILSACEDFVQSVDEPIDVVSSESLTRESQVPFFMNGVIGRYHITHDALTVIACGLSDACVFQSTFVADATFPTFEQIDIGVIARDNNSVDNVFNPLGQARFLADEFLRRVKQIEFTDQALKSQALYIGNLYGGLTRYSYAAYFGLSETKGGGVIDAGPFIPSSEMYGLALDKLEAALTIAPTEYDARVVNSLIGRIHVYMGNYSTAQSFLENGLIPGDPPLQSVHSLESPNIWAAQAGRSRTQYSINARFQEYIEENPQEAARIPIEVLPESELTPAGIEADRDFYRQIKYSQTTEINIISWQENHLLLAEVEVRTNGATGAVRARQLIDEVRASHGIDPLSPTETVDRQLILVERDKELFLTGNRLIDQRRTGTFHLPEGTWRYFPITQDECNNNENIREECKE